MVIYALIWLSVMIKTSGLSLRMCKLPSGGTTSGAPKSPADDQVNSFAKLTTAAAIPLIATPMINPLEVLAREKDAEKGPFEGMALPPDAYTRVGSTFTCKVLNGMWQVSGAHGYQAERGPVESEMARCVDAGFTTFDLADIYGPAEGFVGSFVKGKYASRLAKESQFFTKWVPQPDRINQKMVDDAVGRSLTRMNTEQLDLLQFHWWDYGNKYYFNAMDGLMDLQQRGQIKNIGLTNFDTQHMLELMDQKAPIVSNQVSFSIIDARPLQRMVPACEERGVKLLCYGTLMGGFLSERWLGKPEPAPELLTNVSLRKYLPWIRIWGGWSLLQQLLQVLKSVADKHRVSIANVAVRWVQQQPAVGGAIIGVRFGYSQHVADNAKLFSFTLDEEDMTAIDAVRSKGNDLINVFGDCGGEYRRA